MKQNLVDEARFIVRAGSGGDGSTSFRREKYIPKGGPDGGDGGRGGSVILRANKNIATLRAYAGKDRFEAKSGGRGGKRKKHGRDAEDVVLEVPVGTVVQVSLDDYRLRRKPKLYGERDWEEIEDIGEVSEVSKVSEISGGGEHGGVMRRFGVKDRSQYSVVSSQDQGEEKWLGVGELVEDGQEMVVAYGGYGGRGNTAFKSSTMTTPKFAERGMVGERYEVRLELKVLADVGLVGLPNVGKSTLLSVLSAARPEIGDYPFTTISPNLGVMQVGGMGSTLVVADIPGLIEGAHEGKGLGDRFLRHVERCRVLVYVLAPELSSQESGVRSQEPKTESGQAVDDSLVAEELWEQLEVVKREVRDYGAGLEKKPEMVVVNKIDLLGEEQRVKCIEYFRDKGIEVVLVSAATTEGVEELKKKIVDRTGIEPVTSTMP